MMKRRVGFLAIIILLLGTSLSFAGYNTWTESGPYGGPPNAGGISPNFLYDGEATLCAGGGVYRTQDRGNTWTRVYWQYFRGWHYSPNYQNDHTIFAYDDQYLYKIVNWGTPVKITTPFTGFPDWHSVAISPNYQADHTLFICGGNWNGSSYSGPAGIAKSTNGGASWTMVYNGYGAGCTPGPWSNVYLPPNYGTSHQVVFADGACLYRSTVGGTIGSWSIFSASGWPENSSMIFPADFSGPDTSRMYAYSKQAGQVGLYWSDDGGNTWPGWPGKLSNYLAPPTSSALFDSFEYYHDPDDSTNASDKIYTTACWWNGTTFQGGLYQVDFTLVPPLTPTGWTYKGSPANDPYTMVPFLSPNFKYDNSVVLITLNGLYISTDGGANWSLSPTGHKSYNFSQGVRSNPNLNSTVTYFLASRGGGVFKSTDSGLTWTAKNTGLDSLVVTALRIAPNYDEITNKTVFVACSKVADPYDAESTLIYRSTDGGENWTKMADVEPKFVLDGIDGDAVSFLVIPQNYDGGANQTLFFHTDGKTVNGPQLYESNDNGATWHKYNLNGVTQPDSIYTASLTMGRGPVAGNWVMAGTEGPSSYFYNSTTGGSSWTKVSATGLFQSGVSGYITGPLVPPGIVGDNTILISMSREGGTSTGIYKSTNLGASWTKVKTLSYSTVMAPSWYYQSPADGNKSVIFFSTMWDNQPSSTDHGIWKSTDGGATWSQVGTDVFGFNRCGGGVYTPTPPATNPAGPTLFTISKQKFGLWQYSFKSAPLPSDPDMPAPGSPQNIVTTGNPSADWRGVAVAAGGGNYLLVWEDNRTSGTTGIDIYGAIVKADGTVLVPDIAICTAVNDQAGPKVAFDGTNFLVVWEDNRSGTINIYGARIRASDGALLDGPPTTGGIPICTAVNGQFAPATVFDGTNYLVVWTDYRLTGGPDGDIYGARIRASDGALLDGPPNTGGIAICTATQHQSKPAVAFDGTNYLVVWYDMRVDVNGDIYGRLIDKNGNKLGAADIIICNATKDQVSPAVAFDGTNYLVVWQDGRSNISWDIYGARIRPSDGYNLNPTGIVISNAAGYQEYPTLAFDGTNYLVAWSDNRRGSYDIYGARMRKDGTLIDPSGFLIRAIGATWGFAPVLSYGSSYLDAVLLSTGEVYAQPINFLPTYYLQNGGVSPASDNFGQDFTYSVKFFSPGLALTDNLTVKVFIDGVGYDMSLFSGVSYDGTYKYSTRSLGADVAHTYYFTATFGAVSARYPASGTLSGPTVNLATSTISLSVLPLSITLGQSVTFSGTISPPVAAPVDLFVTPPVGATRTLTCNADAAGNYTYNFTPDMARLTSPSTIDWKISSQWYGTSAGFNSFPISVTTADERALSAAFDGTNYLIPLWQNNNIGFVRINKQGQMVGSKTFLSGVQSGNTPFAAFDGTRYLLIWVNDTTYTFPKEYIQGQFINTDGTPYGTTFDISAPSITGKEQDLEYMQGVVYGGASNNYLVVWTDSRDDGVGCTYCKRKIYGQLISNDGNGTKVGSEIPISTVGGQYGHIPSVAFDGTTNFLVVWVEDQNDSQVWGQLIKASDGSLVGSPILIDNPGKPGDNPPFVFFDGTRYVVSVQNQTGAQSWGSYIRFVNTSGQLVDTSGSPASPSGPPDSTSKITMFDGESLFGCQAWAFDGSYYLIGVSASWGGPLISFKVKYLDTGFSPFTDWITLFTTGADNKVPLFGAGRLPGANQYLVLGFKAVMTIVDTAEHFSAGDVYGVLFTSPLNRDGAASGELTFTVNKAATSLTVGAPANSNYNYPVTITGQLTSGDCPACDRSGLDIQLTFTPSSPSPIFTKTYDAAGNYSYTTTPQDGVFNQNVAWTVRADFAGNSNFLLSTSDTGGGGGGNATVTVQSSAGYAILVQGKILSGEGLAFHNYTTNKIYGKLLDRGFLADDIYYFDYDTKQSGVDASVTKAGIQTAVQTWAKNKMNLSPAPLYIVFVDHGDTNKFMIASAIDNISISPMELDTWLSNLETGLTGGAATQKIFFIYGACKSGSFLPSLSRQTKPNRIVITSTDATGDSYRGPMEDSGLREGDFFVGNFFDYAYQDKYIKEAFQAAAQDIEFLMASYNYDQQSGSAYQKPLLDDNHDSVGTNKISSADPGSDGGTVTILKIGRGAPPANALKFLILTIGGNTVSPQPIALDNANPAITAEVNDETLINDPNKDVWIQVRPPGSYQYTPGTTDPKVLEFPTFVGHYIGSGKVWDWGTTYSDPNHPEFTGFNVDGLYQIIFFARDINGNIAPVKTALYYKYTTSPPTQPGSFDLVRPDYTGASLNQAQPWLFIWGESIDPNGKPVTYTFVIADDIGFSTIHYYQEGLLATSLFFDPNGPGVSTFNDGNTYYWKVLAVNSGGTSIESTHFGQFLVNNSNTILTPYIVGYLKNATTNEPVIGGTVTATSYGSAISAPPAGQYIIALPNGTTTANVQATHVSYYNTPTSPVAVPIPGGGGTANKDFALTPVTNNPTIGSISPTCGIEGYTVTITGTKFGTYDVSKSKVKFNGVEATVVPTPTIQWTNTQIKVTVPAGVTTGPITVEADNSLKSNTNKIFTASSGTLAGSITLQSKSSSDTQGYSTSLTVKAVLAYANATDVCFSTNGTTYGAWQALNPAGTGTCTLNQTLPTLPSGKGDGPDIKLYAKFRNCGTPAGSAAVSASINIDTTTPTGTVQINSGALYTNSTAVALTLTATDPLSNGYASGMNGGQVMISNLSTFAPDVDNTSEWINLTGTGPWSQPWNLQDITVTPFYAARNVYIRFKDKAGKVYTAPAASIMLDKTAPTGSIKINNGADTTNSLTVTLALTAADTGSGLVGYLGAESVRFSNDGSSWGAWEAKVATKSWTLSAGEGIKTVYYQIRDKAGNITELSETIQYFEEKKGSLAVNNGAQYTKSTAVTLAFTWEAGYTKYRLKNKNETTGTESAWGGWNALPANAPAVKSYTLPATNGLYTVKVQFYRTNPVTYSPEYSATIFLDNKAPTGSISIVEGTTTTNAHVTLTLSATDPTVSAGDNSGVAKMVISNNMYFNDYNLNDPEEWLDYDTTYPWMLKETATGTSANRTVYVKFKDAAGNISPLYSAVILLDHTGP